jgi:hypothetical protein
MAHERLRSCIDACVRCAEACEHCADACLHEEDVTAMADCVRLDRDCADVCWLMAAFLSRGSHFAVEACRLCADVYDACADECARHKDMVHCRACAGACRQCARECRAAGVLAA